MQGVKGRKLHVLRGHVSMLRSGGRGCLRKALVVQLTVAEEG